jgi:hypothetical protein
MAARKSCSHSANILKSPLLPRERRNQARSVLHEGKDPGVKA